MNLNKGIKQWAPKDAGTSWYKVMKKEKKKQQSTVDLKISISKILAELILFVE